MKRIEVAVGVLFNEQGEVLIGQRVVKDNYYQKWEFPCLLYTSPSPRDQRGSRMPSSA